MGWPNSQRAGSLGPTGSLEERWPPRPSCLGGLHSGGAGREGGGVPKVQTRRPAAGGYSSAFPKGRPEHIPSPREGRRAEGSPQSPRPGASRGRPALLSQAPTPTAACQAGLEGCAPGGPAHSGHKGAPARPRGSRKTMGRLGTGVEAKWRRRLASRSPATGSRPGGRGAPAARPRGRPPRAGWACGAAGGMRGPCAWPWAAGRRATPARLCSPLLARRGHRRRPSRRRRAKWRRSGRRAPSRRTPGAAARARDAREARGPRNCPPRPALRPGAPGAVPTPGRGAARCPGPAHDCREGERGRKTGAARPPLAGAPCPAGPACPHARPGRSPARGSARNLKITLGFGREERARGRPRRRARAGGAASWRQHGRRPFVLLRRAGAGAPGSPEEPAPGRGPPRARRGRRLRPSASSLEPRHVQSTPLPCTHQGSGQGRARAAPWTPEGRGGDPFPPQELSGLQSRPSPALPRTPAAKTHNSRSRTPLSSQTLAARGLLRKKKKNSSKGAKGTIFFFFFFLLTRSARCHGV